MLEISTKEKMKAGKGDRECVLVIWALIAQEVTREKVTLELKEVKDGKLRISERKVMQAEEGVITRSWGLGRRAFHKLILLSIFGFITLWPESFYISSILWNLLEFICNLVYYYGRLYLPEMVRVIFLVSCTLPELCYSPLRCRIYFSFPQT